MRILIWQEIQREFESSAAFNLALLKAIDPRIITHRPRDPDKARLMKELGMETEIREITRKAKSIRKKGIRRAIPSECADNGKDETRN